MKRLLLSILSSLLFMVSTNVYPATPSLQTVTNVVEGSKPVWIRQGPVRFSSQFVQQAEASVLYDTSPQMLTNERVFKMWLSTSSPTNGMGLSYAESSDGFNWTNYPAQVIKNTQRSSVAKIDGKYYFYGGAPDVLSIVGYFSTDGINWDSIGTVLTAGSAGQWDSSGTCGNNFVWREGADKWYMLYEHSALAGTYQWQVGMATSSNGTNWTKWDCGVIITNGGTGWLTNIGGTYYLFGHAAALSGSDEASDISLYTSTNLTNWVYYYNVLSRTTWDEGAYLPMGQVADPYIVEVGGRTYMWYEGARQSQGGLGETEKMALANMPLAQVINRVMNGTNLSSAWDMYAKSGRNDDIKALMDVPIGVGKPNPNGAYALDVQGAIHAQGEPNLVIMYVDSGMAFRDTMGLSSTTNNLIYIDIAKLVFRDPSRNMIVQGILSNGNLTISQAFYVGQNSSDVSIYMNSGKAIRDASVAPTTNDVWYFDIPKLIFRNPGKSYATEMTYNNGNLGIGVAPSATLHVKGTLKFEPSTTGTPADPATPTAWIPFNLNGTNGFIPWYKQ